MAITFVTAAVSEYDALGTPTQELNLLFSSDSSLVSVHTDTAEDITITIDGVESDALELDTYATAAVDSENDTLYTLTIDLEAFAGADTSGAFANGIVWKDAEVSVGFESVGTVLVDTDEDGLPAEAATTGLAVATNESTYTNFESAVLAADSVSLTLVWGTDTWVAPLGAPVTVNAPTVLVNGASVTYSVGTPEVTADDELQVVLTLDEQVDPDATVVVEPTAGWITDAGTVTNDGGHLVATNSSAIDKVRSYADRRVYYDGGVRVYDRRRYNAPRGTDFPRARPNWASNKSSDPL